jgi:hypothetical protein
MSQQPESKLSRAIIAAIRAHGGYAVKFHGGPMTEAGTPDIVACVPITTYEGTDNFSTTVISRTRGLFVGIETKMPDKRTNVSIIQNHRHHQIRAAGGVAIVVTSVQEAMDALQAMGWVRTTPDVG